ncbi:uncharacterized protein LOC123514415 [Portunus trituberculatus]|uniref:uncharacterized protein LOC123514415 n=1 Tax=Portunus trituberculatus TaxID=210409 RepID=UPI001E1CC74F|nr:uncharacterized protein LOC123514415 [Portunus trituberculatus]XP_045128283.1 uncharacterized protein LOC123514415 [Portunus trituberculatus]
MRESSLTNTTLDGGPVLRVRSGGNLICYSCKLDFRKKDYEKDHPCLGRHGNSRVSEDYAVPCGPNDTFCRVERTEVNGVLTMLRRECTETCHMSCRLRGFGINTEVCEFCCTDDRCNHMYPTDTALRELATKCDYCGLVVRAPPSSTVKVTASRTVIESFSMYLAFTSIDRGFHSLCVVFGGLLWSWLCLGV